MEWPPEFILTRLRQLARLKLQPRELLGALRDLAQQYKAFLSGNEVRQPKKLLAGVDDERRRKEWKRG